MSILRRYVLLQFLRVAGLCQAGAIIIFLIADFIEHIDDLLEKKAAFVDGFLYFALKVPQMVFLSIPVTVLLASILCLVLLTRGNEVVAMRACGASIYQVAAPLLAASFAISLVAFLLNERVVPYANRQGYYVWRVRIKKIPVENFTHKDKLWYRSGDNTFWNIAYFDPSLDVMTKVTLFRLDRRDRITQRVDAERVEWDDAEGQWRFRDGVVFYFEGDGEIRQDPFLSAYLPLRDRPEDFKKTGKKPEEMSWRELRRYIRSIRKSGVDPTRYVVDMWAKLSLPFVSFVLALVGVPFSLRSSRSSGVALGVAVAVLIGAGYLVIFYVGLSLGHAGRLPPLAAAWGPNALFLAGGTYLLSHLRS
ncbi:MAG: LPS export ABC transporter permease LptG [Candidatus Tectomicrobia bacterium RIFCSPLOWO2_12_FULL_69_37]|nr:MAG: LPS export ABC transporter permease LptG [Candidatus Tectomicrobia bacterium RIFCSPLOWO2_02_FULL_70_19]OGL63539.1 MAG: LPS export ABC transporter permease LptG [Candidatus Tectomicrobia bacterium RIFCSPLOWO2_12_FULL_69_37]